MTAAGLAVTAHRLDRGYPHPHLLLVGDRSGRAGDGAMSAGGAQPRGDVTTATAGPADDAYFDIMADERRAPLVVPGPPGAGGRAAGGRVRPGGDRPRRGLRHRRGPRPARRRRGARRSWAPTCPTTRCGHAAGRARAAAARAVVARAEQLPFPAGAAPTWSISWRSSSTSTPTSPRSREYRRVLRPGGTLLVTVPAYESLWSDHDDWAGHRRRYGAGAARSPRSGAAGLRGERTSYYFSFLVPPAAVLRRTPLAGWSRASRTRSGRRARRSTAVMTGLAGAERRWARRRAVPFGLSIACLCDRP